MFGDGSPGFIVLLYLRILQHRRYFLLTQQNKYLFRINPNKNKARVLKPFEVVVFAAWPSSDKSPNLLGTDAKETEVRQ
jgi:hypothetical protein